MPHSLLVYWQSSFSSFDLHAPFIDMPPLCCLTTTASAAVNEQGSQIFLTAGPRKQKNGRDCDMEQSVMNVIWKEDGG